MQKIIGGAVPYREGVFKVPFQGGNYLLLTNARSALYALHQLLQPKTTWLPSYICRSVIHPSYNVKFYHVNEKLESFIDGPDDDDLVLVVDYFGWQAKIPSKGIVVEDAAQAFFTPKRADYVIYSPSKCLGSPDGGILWAKTQGLTVELQDAPREWTDAAREGRRSERSDWFAMTQVAKKRSPTGLYRMCYENCLTYEDEWPSIYIRNYNHLQSRLSHLSLMGELPVGVVPSGFPIVTDNRDDMRKKLFDNEIYPPVHWDISGVIPDSFVESHRLSKRIMTLPCDYRYGLDDMERMIRVLC